MQLLFWLIFLPPTANFTRLWRAKGVREISRNFGAAVEAYTPRWSRLFEQFWIAGATVTPLLHRDEQHIP